MDKTLIAQIASRMSNRDDLLALLNQIRKDDVCKSGDMGKFYPFTIKHLLYYCNPNNSFHRYRQFKIKKKSGGFRQITSPRNKSFMLLLQSVNEMLKAMYTPSEYAMGFVEGRSVVSNAAAHKGHNYIFNIDLKDFFPSIEQPRVWKRLQLAPFNFPEAIANVIAGLCSMRELRKTVDGKDEFVYVLPQGAPTSPIITNMICDKLDHRLAGLARRFGLHYTRYADDITFSSMHYVYAKNGEFRKELARIINGQGFVINEAKTRLQKIGDRQEVTGIIVSNKLNVVKEYVREIRSLLYIWEWYGYSVAMSRFLPKYKAEKGHVKKGNPELSNVLMGKLMYLKMVKGESDSVYIKLYKKFCKLIENDSALDKTNSNGITYVETIPLIVFEQENNTKVAFQHGECNKRYASFHFADIKQIALIHKSVTLECEQNTNMLAISNCINSKGKHFWLVHLMDKKTVFKHTAVNIDELNNDLDVLLNK